MRLPSSRVRRSQGADGGAGTSTADDTAVTYDMADQSNMPRLATGASPHTYDEVEAPQQLAANPYSGLELGDDYYATAEEGTGPLRDMSSQSAQSFSETVVCLVSSTLKLSGANDPLQETRV